MKIKKTFQTTVPTGKVLNNYTESNTDTYSCDYVNELETYYTDETRVGTWIDGKPIYRKVYQISISQANVDVNTNLNISNLDKVLNFSGSISSNGLYVPLNYSYSNTNVRCYITASLIQITSAFTGTANVVVEYTKTTD